MFGLFDQFNTDDPTKQARLAQSLALLEAGGPSRVPVSLFQGLGMAGKAGLEAKRQAQKDAQAKLLQDMQLQQFTAQREDAQRKQAQEAAKQAAIQGFDPANPETWKPAIASGALPLTELMKQQGKTGLMQVGSNVFDPEKREWITPPQTAAKAGPPPAIVQAINLAYGEGTPQAMKAIQDYVRKETRMPGGGSGGTGMPAPNAPPPGLKLKPGEVWNPTAQRVDAVRGSSLYQTQAGTHSKDYGALQGIETKTDNALAKIAKVLDPKNADAFNSNFGGYNAMLTQYLPGAQDVRAEIESIKSDLKGAGLELMRSGGSIGQMTQQEWPIVQNMIATITPTLSEPEARQKLQEVAAYLERIRNNARTTYDKEWGDSQFKSEAAQREGGATGDFSPTKPAAPTKGPVKIASDADYNALPSGAEFIGPDGKKRRKP